MDLVLLFGGFGLHVVLLLTRNSFGISAKAFFSMDEGLRSPGKGCTRSEKGYLIVCHIKGLYLLPSYTLPKPSRPLS